MPEHSARADDPLVIVGASLSGVRAAEGARAQGWTGRIVMVGEEPHLPYDRPPLSKALLDAETEPALPLLRQAEGWEALDVELMTSTAATAVDVDRKILLTTSEPIGYRALVIATGHRARSLDELAGFAHAPTLRRCTRHTRNIVHCNPSPGDRDRVHRLRDRLGSSRTWNRRHAHRNHYPSSGPRHRPSGRSDARRSARRRGRHPALGVRSVRCDVTRQQDRVGAHVLRTRVPRRRRRGRYRLVAGHRVVVDQPDHSRRVVPRCGL